MAKRKAWLIGLVVGGLLLVGPGLVVLLQMAWHERRLAREHRALERTHHALAQEYERLSSDPVYLERVVRATFKVARPNEVVVPLEAIESSERSR